MTSEPSLSQEDIVLLLAVGMTRAELDQLQASSIGASIALNYLGAASGADRAVKQALPIIDDFRFGSAYSTVTGKTEPQLTVGKRLTNDLRASVTAGSSEDRELRSNIEWRLNNTPERARVVRQHQRRLVVGARQPRRRPSLEARVRVARCGSDHEMHARAPSSIACCAPGAVGLALRGLGRARSRSTPSRLAAAPRPPRPGADAEPPPDLAAFVGKPITRVTVVLEGNVWADVEVARRATREAGRRLTPAAARRALDELLASGASRAAA